MSRSKKFIAFLKARFSKRDLLFILSYYSFIGIVASIGLIFHDQWFAKYCVYFAVLGATNHFMPLPIVVYVYFLGQSDPNIINIAIIGSIASSMANSMEYYILSKVRPKNNPEMFSNRPFLLFVKQNFQKSPFLLIVAFNILPTPIDPVRWLAILFYYPFIRFMTANFVGRLVRYSLIAAIAQNYPVNERFLLYIGGLLILISVVQFIFKKDEKVYSNS